MGYIEHIHRHPGRLTDRFHKAHKLQSTKVTFDQQVQITLLCCSSLRHRAEEDRLRDMILI